MITKLEQGPELVELQKGAKVNTASETSKKLGNTTINIYTEKSNPSEIAREIKNAQRRLAYGL